MDNFTGGIIEESLENSNVLRKVKIMKTRIEKATERHKTPWLKKWTIHTVEVQENNMPSIAIEVSRTLEPNHPWYADFKNSKFHYLIFPNKIFKVDKEKKEEYQEPHQYGLSLGIPEYQLIGPQGQAGN